MKKNTARGPKEMVRKFFVSLKRRPQNIPLVALLITFLVYSLNLTSISNTTAKIQGPQMGLCGFVTMLLSILSFVCFLNAFPKRQKTNVPMLVLYFVMLAIVIFADIMYNTRIISAITRADNPIVITKSTEYIIKAQNIVIVHIVLVGVTALLTALLPVYSKLIRKINTSVTVEDNGDLDVIDISEE